MTIENFFGRLNEDGLFADQIVDHRGLSEIYVHLGAAIWLFVAAMIAIIFIWATFGRREQGWLALISGIFSVGLIGFGKAAEHFFTAQWYDFFHYLHILAAPVSLFFLYLAVDELRLLYYYNASKKTLNPRTTAAILGVVVVTSAILGYQAAVALDMPIEMPILSITLIPTVVIAYMLVRRSFDLYREQYRVPLFSLSTVSTILTLIPLMAWGAVMLSLVIWLGRVADIAGAGLAYAIFHTIQDLFHGGMGAVMLGSVMILALGRDTAAVEDSVIQSSKLISLGEMTVDVAAELNNPLMSIVGYTTLILEDEEVPARRRRDLELVLREASKAVDMTKHLLDFAGRSQPKLQVMDIEGPLDGALGLMAGRMRQTGVKIVKSMQKPLPFVSIKPDQLKQAFVNILNNAVDAMPGGGQLEVYVTAQEREIEICFTDTGTGMSTETIKRIFEPFYSSGSKQGTGLGLSLALSIAKEHGGEMEVSSQKGIGSTFTIKLPTIESADALADQGGAGAHTVDDGPDAAAVAASGVSLPSPAAGARN